MRLCVSGRGDPLLSEPLGELAGKVRFLGPPRAADRNPQGEAWNLHFKPAPEVSQGVSAPGPSQDGVQISSLPRGCALGPPFPVPEPRDLACRAETPCLPSRRLRCRKCSVSGVQRPSVDLLIGDQDKGGLGRRGVQAPGGGMCPLGRCLVMSSLPEEVAFGTGEETAFGASKLQLTELVLSGPLSGTRAPRTWGSRGAFTAGFLLGEVVSECTWNPHACPSLGAPDSQSVVRHVLCPREQPQTGRG